MVPIIIIICVGLAIIGSLYLQIKCGTPDNIGDPIAYANMMAGIGKTKERQKKQMNPPKKKLVTATRLSPPPPVDKREVDFDVLEGRKPPSKEELEEGEREHLFVVDREAWMEEMKKTEEPQIKERLERLPLSPGQEILELKKRVSDLEVQLKDIWGHLRKLNKNGT